MKRTLLTLTGFALLLNCISCGRLYADGGEDDEIFEYRDIYLPTINDDENEELRLHNIDDNWGIWGHNLSVVLPEIPSKQIYATYHGGLNKEQFCFSNSKLYNYIVDYINGNYLFSDSMRFAILPNDNSIVCMCATCRALGNTETNAAPAVFNLIEKLSKKFPKHKFFTSYYLTTTQLPKEHMAPNSGVLISAIDYPLTVNETQKEKEFMDLIAQWKTKTDKIYIWDYINNYDDYFTPYPVFSVMQHRIRKYRDAGVDGIFFNGSGHDYSTFSRLKKAVLAQLLQTPDADWRELLMHYAAEYYPVAGKDIANFMITQEEMVATNGKALPLYEGIREAKRIYLPEPEFVEFYNRLVAHKAAAKGDEQRELETMTDAMALTMLEIKRLNNDIEDTDKLKARLAQLPKQDIHYYNEGCWNINQYLANYEYMEENSRMTEASNLLKGVELHPRTALDEEYTDISIVTDGLLGMPSNYHNGNLISSADPAFSLSIPRVPGMSKLKVWMVYNPGFRIGLPEEVYITVGGVKQNAQVPEKPQGGAGHSFLEFNVPSGGDIVLTLKKDPEVHSMAIDEIQGF